MIYHRELSIWIFGNCIEEKISQTLYIESRIEKYIERPQCSTIGAKSEKKRLVIHPDNPEWLNMRVGEEVAFEWYACCSYADVHDWMTIHVVEEIHTRKEYNYDTEEIST